MAIFSLPLLAIPGQQDQDQDLANGEATEVNQQTDNPIDQEYKPVVEEGEINDFSDQAVIDDEVIEVVEPAVSPDPSTNSISKYNYIFYFIYKYKYENRSGVNALKSETFD